MAQTELALGTKKRIALVAHDNRKEDLLEWAKYNRGTLAKHTLYATGRTGKLLEKELSVKVDQTAEWASGRRSATRRKDHRRGNRFSDLLLGSFGTPSARYGCESSAENRRGVEYSRSLQSGICRLHDLLPPHVGPVSEERSGLYGLRGTDPRRSHFRGPRREGRQTDRSGRLRLSLSVANGLEGSPAQTRFGQRAKDSRTDRCPLAFRA